MHLMQGHRLVQKNGTRNKTKNKQKWKEFQYNLIEKDQNHNNKNQFEIKKIGFPLKKRNKIITV